MDFPTNLIGIPDNEQTNVEQNSNHVIPLIEKVRKLEARKMTPSLSNLTRKI
jgi:hypothetical protein